MNEWLPDPKKRRKKPDKDSEKSVNERVRGDGRVGNGTFYGMGKISMQCMRYALNLADGCTPPLSLFSTLLHLSYMNDACTEWICPKTVPVFPFPFPFCFSKTLFFFFVLCPLFSVFYNPYSVVFHPCVGIPYTVTLCFQASPT